MTTFLLSYFFIFSVDYCFQLVTVDACFVKKKREKKRKNQIRKKKDIFDLYNSLKYGSPSGPTFEGCPVVPLLNFRGEGAAGTTFKL